VEVRVLGPLLVTIAGKPAEIGAAQKRRLVLAVLLARAGRPVPIDTLVEAVWPDRPPASARRNLQLYVHQLRGVLGGERIAAGADGYAIDAGDRLDAGRFRELTVAGGAALDTGDAAGAEATLRTALDLWRGPAFAEFLDCELVAEEAARLELRRLETYERWAEAQLVTGATPRLAAELTELCRLHPYRESLRGHMMRALYQTGRRVEALAVFRETRALLVDEVGVEPGPTLQRLHEAMLRGDEALVPPPRTEVRLSPPSPRQLPPAPTVFAGREEALALLDESLPGDGRSGRTVAICGMGGVGKTTLAVHWAHRVADRFPDGQLYVHLRGYAPGTPMRPIEALGLVLRALGVPPAQVPVDLDGATGMYRTRLAERRLLMVLDNARDAEQVRPLLPAAAGCLALITSRDRLTGLAARDGIRRLTLDVLTPAEAVTLVGRLVGDVDQRAATALAEACGFLPLAIQIAAAHLADRPGASLADHAEALRRDAGLGGLEIDGDPEASVRSAFTHSYRALDPAAQRLFRLLGLVPGLDVTVPAAAVLAGTDAAQAQRLLDSLVRAHLVTAGRSGRYTLHDLLRLYAREQVAAATDGLGQAEAAGRLYDFYLYTLDAAARMLYPRAVRLPVDVPEGHPRLVGFPDQAAAVEWVDAELANLVAAIRYAAAAGPWRTSWLLADSLGGYFWLRSRHGTQWLATAEAGLAAATAGGDEPALAAAHLNLALAHRSLHRPATAIRHATEALAMSRRSGWLEGQASALSELTADHAELGHNGPALAALDEALAVNRRIGGHARQAGPLAARSGLRFRMGQLRESLSDGLAALELYRGIRNPAGEAYAHVNTALSYLYLGRFEAARDHVTRSLRLFEPIGERYGRALAQCILAKLHIDAGRTAAAVECATATLHAARSADDSIHAAFSLIDLVEARRQLGDREHAVRDCTWAVQAVRRANRPHAEAVALISLAEAHRYDGRLDRALTSVAAARRITERYGYRLLEGHALTVLAEVQLAAGDRAASIESGEAALAIHRETGYRLGEARAHRLLEEPVPGIEVMAID
jgi:DNA-binding SARP family transcriptional activator/tetratricopeptide (TPR) repeat protein